MQIQFSTTESCSYPLLPHGLSFEGVPPEADPPENSGGGTGTTEPEEEEEPDPPDPPGGS